MWRSTDLEISRQALDMNNMEENKEGSPIYMEHNTGDLNALQALRRS